MTDYLFYALLGSGAGAVIALLGLGVVLTYQGSGVVNFAAGAMATWPAFAFVEMRTKGTYPLPIPGLPDRVSFGGRLQFAPALILALATGLILGLLIHLLVFRPLRHAPALARIVGNVGVLIALLGLVSQRFADQTETPAKILPGKPVTLWGDLSVPQDGLWLAALALCIAAVLWALSRCTRTGLAVRAAAENDKGVALLGWSSQRLAALTWMIGGLLAATTGVLGSPLTQLNPTAYTFSYLVPGLGAALIGRFSSYGWTAVTGLLIGIGQSVYTKLQGDLSFLPEIGAREGIPFLVIIVVLIAGGRSIADRGEAGSTQLAQVPTAGRAMLPGVVCTVVALIAIVTLDSGWLLAVTSSVIATVLALSFVVVTGFVGQTSLSQVSFAGIGGFALARLGTDWGVPFPIAPLLAALVAGVFGVVVGLPALRTRGTNLALLTLAGGVAIQEFVFKNSKYTGATLEIGGASIGSPTIGGLDLGLVSDQDLFRPHFALLCLAVCVALCVMVANLRRSATGRRMLAVRRNERAAAAVGIDVALTKLAAFGVASTIAGLGGALIAYRFGTISDASYGLIASLTALAFAYIGGLTSVSGAVIAGLLSSSGVAFYALNQGNQQASQWEVTIGGVMLIVAAIAAPNGIAGRLSAYYARRWTRAR